VEQAESGTITAGGLDIYRVVGEIECDPEAKEDTRKALRIFLFSENSKEVPALEQSALRTDLFKKTI